MGWVTWYTPTWSDPPGRHPPRRLMSGRYASYWNAFLYLSCVYVPDVTESHFRLDHILGPDPGFLRRVGQMFLKAA